MSRKLFTIQMLQDLKNSEKLVSPDYQRPINNSRVSILKKYIIDNYDRPEFYMPDVVLNEVKGTYKIVDGQHRLRAFIKIVGNEREMMKKFEGVYAIVKDNLSPKMEKKLFVMINQSVPCPKIYLHSSKEKKMLTRLRIFINSKYSHQISGSLRCVSPNINVSTIIDAISKKNLDGSSVIGDWFGDQTIYKSDDLCKGIEKFNEHVRTLLLSPDGFKIYKINCPRRSSRHNEDKFKKLLDIVVKKSMGDTPCYLGFIDPDRIARCMFEHGKLY